MLASIQWRFSPSFAFALTPSVTLPTDGNVINLLGFGTTIDFLSTTGWQLGSVMALRLFGGTPTYVHNAPAPPAGFASMILKIRTNLVPVASEIHVFILDTATTWREIGNDNNEQTPWLQQISANDENLVDLQGLRFLGATDPLFSVNQPWIIAVTGTGMTSNINLNDTFSWQTFGIQRMGMNLATGLTLAPAIINTHPIPGGATSIADIGGTQTFTLKTLSTGCVLAAPVDVRAIMKSGRFFILENVTSTITFTTAFGAVPNMTAVIGDIQSGQDSIVTLDNITAAGFDVRVEHVGGGGAVTRDVEWIATIAGDP